MDERKYGGLTLAKMFEQGRPFNPVERDLVDHLTELTEELALARSNSRLTSLNEHTRFILGRPNFTTIGIANLLRKRGDEISHRSEDEQAATIHFLLNMYELHGEGWREAADVELGKMHEMLLYEGGAA